MLNHSPKFTAFLGITYIILIQQHMALIDCITVDRSFRDFNDKFELGLLKPWEYECNKIQGNQCSCYYRGTYYGDQDTQAMCHKSSKFNQICTDILHLITGN